MTTLIQIGNSKGIRIPKAIIKQAHLEDVEIDFEVLEEGLLIKPSNKKVRKGWVEQIDKALAKGMNEVNEFCEFDLDVEDWEW